jgi:hypothetical protein
VAACAGNNTVDAVHDIAWAHTCPVGRAAWQHRVDQNSPLRARRAVRFALSAQGQPYITQRRVAKRPQVLLAWPRFLQPHRVAFCCMISPSLAWPPLTRGLKLLRRELPGCAVAEHVAGLPAHASQALVRSDVQPFYIPIDAPCRP